MIDSAKSCGADAVKFQSWSTSSLISEAEYTRNTSYSDKKKHFGSLAEMVQKYQLTPEQHRDIAEYCGKRSITFLSSCFSAEEVDLLDALKVPAFKIASMDINNLDLLRYVAARKRAVILSTGMSTLGEIEQAIQVAPRRRFRACCALALHLDLSARNGDYPFAKHHDPADCIRCSGGFQ